MNTLEQLVENWKKTAEYYHEESGIACKNKHPDVARQMGVLSQTYKENARELEIELNGVMVLPEVDLNGEIPEGRYLCLCWYPGQRTFLPTEYKWGSWQSIGKVLKAYGPLPILEGKDE